MRIMQTQLSTVVEVEVEAELGKKNNSEILRYLAPFYYTNLFLMTRVIIFSNMT